MRTFQLTEDQTKQFRKAGSKAVLIKEILPELINSLLEQAIEDDDAFWDDLFEICGADRQTENLSFNHRTGIVTITPINGKADES